MQTFHGEEPTFHEGFPSDAREGPASILRRDLSHAVRLARQSPGFTTVAVLTLGLAIGANTAIFSVVEAVLLRPLPFRDPGGLVYIWNEYGGHHAASAVPDYLDRRDAGRTLQSIAAFTFGDATMTGGGEPLRVRVAGVTPSFFDVVGRAASVGRVLSSSARACSSGASTG